jgi:flotillin
VEAEAEAERRQIEARAEAAAIYARLEAEARGQYEILAKKGEGLRAIVEATGGAKEAYQLMLLEHLDKIAETAATAISNVKFDKVVVWDTGSNGSGQTATSSFLQGMTRSLPPMMSVLRDIAGVELPGYLGTLAPEPGERLPNGAEQHEDGGRAPAPDGVLKLETPTPPTTSR